MRKAVEDIQLSRIMKWERERSVLWALKSSYPKKACVQVLEMDWKIWRHWATVSILGTACLQGLTPSKKRFCTENLHLKPCLPNSVTVVGWSRTTAWHTKRIQKKNPDLTDWMLPLNKGVNCSQKNKTIDKTQPPPYFNISPVCYNCYSSVLGKRSHYLTLHSVI